MNYKKFLRAAGAALMIVIVITLVLAPAASAQTKFKTLYKFKGGKDGNQPIAGVVLDQAGNIYGTTQVGGSYGHGSVFQLKPNTSGGWEKKALHSFTGKDGSNPYGDLTLDAQGNLYGTTIFGGKGACNGYGCGVAFELIPNTNGSWKEKPLSYFSGNVGVNPASGLIRRNGQPLWDDCRLVVFLYRAWHCLQALTELRRELEQEHAPYVRQHGWLQSGCWLDFRSTGNLYSATDYGGVYGEGVVFN